jgi:WD40 repeat protein
MIKVQPHADAGLAAAMQHMTLNPAAPPAPKNTPQVTCDLQRVRVVQNVHQDDIHSIVRLHDQTFITGSKDGSLKKWRLDGTLVCELYNPQEIDYTKWVTASAVINDNYWISGNREGAVHLWDNAGKCIKDLRAEPYQSDRGPKCKERNMRRVHCLTSLESHLGKPFFLAGWPTQFTVHSYDDCRRLSYTFTSGNDWVYAIQPINKKALLVITGCRLDLYTYDLVRRRWFHNRPLITEGERTEQRPFISAITPLRDNPNLFGLAVFDRAVRVIDIASGNVMFAAQEHNPRNIRHKDRVWTIENIQPHCFASCGDDGLIKLWDIRRPPQSIVTVRDNTEAWGRVSILMQINDQQFLSGSCPDDVRNCVNKAQFSFWDIRRLQS